MAGDSHWWKENQEPHWWEQQTQLETRLEWGVYYPNSYPELMKKAWYEQPIISWRLESLSGLTDIDRLKEITDQLKENIDNIWEGPIGYMGLWKFRFTNEFDTMIFRLIA